jgi:hypothetical protein
MRTTHNAHSETRAFFQKLLLTALVAATGYGSHAQVSVLTYKYDAARTGQNVQETILTPAAVAGGMFHKIFTAPLDGYVYAQPLYVATVNNVSGGIPGHAYNVIYVATEHDSIYALDADSNHPTGTTLWNKNYLPPGETPVASVADLNCTDLIPEVGITSTPVIDPATATLYMVTKSKGNGAFHQRLHAISTTDGTEKFGGPAEISAQLPGINGTFDPLFQLNRAALLLDHGNIVIGWSSHCDTYNSHGWVMIYAASTLQQVSVFSTTPNGHEAGVWMSGDGIAADANGRLYFASGNGTYDGAANNDYGDSVLRLDPQADGAFAMGDFFTPHDQDTMNADDQDLGAGGLLLLPSLAAGAPHPNLLVQMGKNGTMYLLDRDNMGKFCSACAPVDTQVVQEIPRAAKGMWGTPAYWNNFIYWSSGRPSDSFKAWQFNVNGKGAISTTPSSKTARTFSFSAASPVVSANGTTGGVVWLLDNGAYSYVPTTPPGPQILWAFDATDLTKVLFSSAQAGGQRDQPGLSVKFTSPIIANGRVFAGAVNSVTAWGLVPAPSNTRPKSNAPNHH